MQEVSSLPIAAGMIFARREVFHEGAASPRADENAIGCVRFRVGFAHRWAKPTLRRIFGAGQAADDVTDELHAAVILG
jgi:hypothetical protein